MTDLSVVVPCYNEEKNLPLIVDRFSEILADDISVQVRLVDNGSSDGSAAVMEELSADNDFLRITTVEENRGYGYGIWRGLSDADGEFVCWTHADMQTDPADTVRAYRLAQEQPDPTSCYVKGDRKGRPFVDTFFTRGMSLFETVLMGTRLRDINAQPNLFHRSLLEEVDDPPDGFSFDLYFYYTAKQLGYDVVRFDVEFPERVHGESNWNTSLRGKWNLIKRTVAYSWELKRRSK
ncbi:glycosyltransferase family 2 protein [Halobaculum sp. P14]|uniref:glycosyltransferase family 2 protein n=1 Tax=Halobaculum sp. P14 TaxID=3421638 RepID=UPI003EBB6B25